MNPEDDSLRFHRDGKEFRVVDQYRRHHPDAAHVGKSVWFTLPGGKDIYIGKITGVMPISYQIEHVNAGSPIIRKMLINSQCVIIPEVG